MSDDLTREQQAVAIEAGRVKDSRRSSADRRAGWGRWEISICVEVAPHEHYGDDDPLAATWHEGGTERWPPGATPTEIAVESLREAADEIESGDWRPVPKKGERS